MKIQVIDLGRGAFFGGETIDITFNQFECTRTLNSLAKRIKTELDENYTMTDDTQYSSSKKFNVLDGNGDMVLTFNGWDEGRIPASFVSAIKCSKATEFEAAIQDSYETTVSYIAKNYICPPDLQEEEEYYSVQLNEAFGALPELADGQCDCLGNDLCECTDFS